MALFIITSETHPAASPNKNLYNYLTDFKNFRDLLPEDKVENFACDEEKCSFNIKGITPLTVRIAEKVPFSKIVFESEGLAKFNFRLQANFTGDAESAGSCNIELKGDINPFIKVMAEKPLTQLVNSMAEKLGKLKV